MSGPQRDDVGAFCLVLHSHLPWLAHHGAWPVGEEWLHQAWAESYRRVVDVLTTMARDDVAAAVTVGITPILAAQWDDAYCLREHHTWLGMWHARAQGMCAEREPWRRVAGRRELADATAAIETFETTWRHGGSAAWRPLVDAGVVEVLGGPLTHSFTPLLDPAWACSTLREGLVDTRVRLGHAPTGIWTPECAYRPGLADTYAAAGVQHLVLDGPTLLGAGATTADLWTLEDTEVVVAARDLEVAYRVWSPRRGYPGDPWYRDFHTFDHDWGFRPRRVTGRTVEPMQKAPYDPLRARAVVERDAADFVGVVRRRLEEVRTARDGRPGVVVAAYDTELFGHWWHEGPLWLDRVLRLLPDAGVRVTTLADAVTLHGTAGRVDPREGSWGSGKDWRVWAGEAVQDTPDRLAAATARVSRLLTPGGARCPARDQLVRNLLLALSSDWPFMVSKDTAAGYARTRLADHLADVDVLADRLEAGDHAGAREVARRHRRTDGPFGGLDARRFAGPQ